jgi:hypothetical protein
MFDNITIVKHIGWTYHVIHSINEPLEQFNLEFYPNYKKGEVVSYSTKFKNMYLTIRDNQLIIRNSLCKFFHGYNHKNLTGTQLNEAVTSLENTLGISLRDSLVRSFEYGVVLPVKDPKECYQNWHLYKGRTPQIMAAKGREYGVSYENSTHRLKCYNKTFEAKRNGFYFDRNLIRIEKRVTPSHLNSSPRFKNNTIVTLDDLCSWKVLELLGEDLIISLRKIELKNLPSGYDELSTKDLRIWGYMQFDPIRRVMSKYHPEAFKVDRAKYNKIQQEYKKYNQDVFIEEASYVIEKCINN